MLFKELAERMRAVESASKRLEMTRLLSETFRAASPAEARVVAHLLLGTLAPEHEAVEVGLAEKMAHRLLHERTGAPEERILALQVETGDLGSAAETLWAGPRRAQVGLDAFVRAGRPAPAQGVLDVHAALVGIARLAGEGSQEDKLALAGRLLQDASAVEARYMFRFLVGKLRLGVADMTVLDGAALAYAPPDEVVVEKDGLPRAPEAWRAAIERAYNLTSDIGRVVSTAATEGLSGLARVTITPGAPVRPMLAERLTEPADILAKLGVPALAELKYDGLRIQAHLWDGRVRLFSRRLEDVTAQFPDVVEALRRAVRDRRAVLEGEAVPVDAETGRLRPFQDVSRRRGRKHDLERVAREVPVTLFLFDLLLLDDEDWTVRPLDERRAALAAAVAPGPGVALSEAAEVADVAGLETFFEDAVARGAEGIMVKALGPAGTYQAGARGWRWIKYKRDYVEALADSLDLVIVGAWHGKGRRAGWYGALLGAARDPASGRFETVCKVGTGFTDELLGALNARLDPHRVPRAPPDVSAVLVPDVWFAPAVVAEVRGAELSRSPVHTCGRADGEGLALRFPRFVRWREDKGPDEATTTEEVRALYAEQRPGGSPPPPS